MSEQDKPTDAEEIFAESQKLKTISEESTEQKTNTEETPTTSQITDIPQEAHAEETPSEPQITDAPQEAHTDEDSSRKIRDVIFVGIKPIMTYVTATLTQLSTQPVVTIKARGQRITQAVDVSQMIIKRMNTVGYQIKDVRIASDSLLSQDGKTRNVSTIEIDITKA